MSSWVFDFEPVERRELGFRKGEKNLNHKLTAEQVKKIREFHGKGVSQQALARRYGVSQNAIFRIVHDLTWKEERLSDL